MLSFSTEFPVPDDVTASKFCDVVSTWISGSRFTRFRPAALLGLGEGESWDVLVEDESIETLTEVTADSESVAVIYRKIDAGLEWITTLVYAGQPSSNWISVRVECDPLHPRAKVPAAKKPVVVRILLDAFGGGVDGDFMVSGQPVILTPSEIDLAIKVVGGKVESYLPVVYVSTRFDGRYLVDPNGLSQALVGMAHVVVEPDRTFSISLMAEVNRKNPYGGNIALYWTEGGGRRSFFAKNGIDTPAEIQSVIEDEIRQSLNNRRPLIRCTLNAVKELKSRRQINSLKDAGSAKVDEYVTAFEGEIEAKGKALEAAEHEINRLKAEVRMYESLAVVGGDEGAGLTLNLGNERDYYEGEILDIVCDALESGTARVTQDGRRQHVLAAITAANPLSTERAKNRDRIKALLRGYRSMDASTRRELEQIGFTITDSGKHLKLVYQNDDRYTFTLAKSGSDNRGGLNAAGDLCRLLF